MTENRTMLPEDAPGRSHHDLGGVSRYTCEPVDKSAHELTDFDRDVDALRQVLTMNGHFTTDELRRGIEALPDAVYDAAPYYEKWLYSMITGLQERGLITEAELIAELQP